MRYCRAAVRQFLHEPHNVGENERLFNQLYPVDEGVLVHAIPRRRHDDEPAVRMNPAHPGQDLERIPVGSPQIEQHNTGRWRLAREAGGGKGIRRGHRIEPLGREGRTD